MSGFTPRVGGGSAYFLRHRSHTMIKAKHKRIAGWSLILIGVLVIVFSPKIVFPFLEHLLGIETIVGHEWVVYQPDGGYLATNPGAMARWVLSVAAVGVLILWTGIWLLIKSGKDAD
jgi:ascorbate-specific PTS system EIIC-type component UlaA